MHIRVSGNYPQVGESPFELTQRDCVPGRWERLLMWLRRIRLRRILPFLFLGVLGAQEAAAPPPVIPDKLQVRYFKAKADLAQVIQEMVTICKGDVGLNPDGSLVCIAPRPETKPETPSN